MKDIDDVSSKLKLRRDELLDRLRKITSDVRHEGEAIEADFAEQAVQRENDQVMDAIGEAARQELTQINVALARIDSGDYGVCSECGRNIGPQRLEVLPYSTMCLECASRTE